MGNVLRSQLPPSTYRPRARRRVPLARHRAIPARSLLSEIVSGANAATPIPSDALVVRATLSSVCDTPLPLLRSDRTIPRRDRDAPASSAIVPPPFHCVRESPVFLLRPTQDRHLSLNKAPPDASSIGSL